MMRITAVVRGRVQGVNYRYFVTYCAQERGVSGYVRNIPDGSVLIVAEGSDKIVDEFIQMVWVEGDPVILVRGIEITKSISNGEFSGVRDQMVMCKKEYGSVYSLTVSNGQSRSRFNTSWPDFSYGDLISNQGQRAAGLLI